MARGRGPGHRLRTRADVVVDVQPQKLPVIFVPGFLGSRHRLRWQHAVARPCRSPTWWGCGSGRRPRQLRHVRPRRRPASWSETVLSSDIYKSGREQRSREVPRWPRHAVRLGLAQAPAGVVLELRHGDRRRRSTRDGPWKDQQAGRVVLWGHSYGGLLIRAFVDGAGGARVARVLTAGTPYWGSPKSVFPLAFGVESPLVPPRRAHQQQSAEELRRRIWPVSTTSIRADRLRAPGSRVLGRGPESGQRRRLHRRRGRQQPRCSTRHAATTSRCTTKLL